MSAGGCPNILVIDDDKTIIYIVKTVLSKNGFKALVACDGKEGIEIARSNLPDAIILDRSMPGMDGNETLIQLKEDSITSNIPVLMLTGDNRASDIVTSFELGAEDYMVKPFNTDDLIVRLNRLLNSGRDKQSVSV